MFSRGFAFEQKESGWGEIVPDKVSKLVQGEENSEGDVLHEKNDKEISGLQQVKVLEKLVQFPDSLDEESVKT